MALKANELADKITEYELKRSSRAYMQLRAKCYQEISVMAAKGDWETLVDLNDDDLIALDRITEELRSLGYRFKFIERQDQNGEFLCDKLKVSIRHCKKDYL